MQITPEPPLDPPSCDPKTITCTVCGNAVYPGEHYTTIDGKLLCDDFECFADHLKTSDLSFCYKLYAKAFKGEFLDYLEGDIFRAVDSGRMDMAVIENGNLRIIKGENIYKAFAYDDFDEFARWYQEKIYSGEDCIYE